MHLVELAPNAVTTDELVADLAAGSTTYLELQRDAVSTTQHQLRRPSTLMHVLHVRQGGRSKYTVKEDKEPTRVSVQADALGRRLSPSRA